MRFPLRVATLTTSLVLVATPALAVVYPDPAVQRGFVVGGARVTALVVSPDRGMVASVAANTPLPPASTTKLLTVGTALQTMGPFWTYRTQAVLTSDGDLVLVGAGDPTLTHRDLQALAAGVAASGQSRISGALRIDDSLFDRARGALGWPRDYVGYEAGPLSAFMVDHNLWRHDAAYRKNPLPASLKLWRKYLKAAGVTVAGRDLQGPSPTSVTQVLAEHVSAPLQRIAKHTLQTSDNTEAEMLLKSIDAFQGRSGSTAGGVAAVKELSRSWGVALNGRIVDGSGLSRADRLDARSTVAWLQALDDHGLGTLMRQVLPVSCRSGTLKERLCGRWLSGRVSAKTGTLDHTAALAGWARTRSGREVVFAVAVDGPWWTNDRKALDLAMTGLLRSKNL